MGKRLVVSEFPNDNPDLHDGLVWACPSPCAPALPTLRLRAAGAVRVLKPGWEKATPAPPVVGPPLPVALAPAFVESELASEPEPARAVAAESARPEDLEVTASDPPPNGFASFVAALAAILAERGATRAATSVGALLGLARLAPDAFDATTATALVARGMLDPTSGRPTPEFSVLARAWRDVLDDTGGDLSACGSATLDVFGANLLATLLGLPSGRAEELRRALRQRGVAAFGMLVAA
jgi:hypothetical protein